MIDIVKRFPGVLANDHINFELLAGEVHALLGENGAGKTTLMNILYGLYRPDEGRILVKGGEAKIRSPRDAITLGIGMVHQHLKLVDSHTIAENVVLGLHDPRFVLRMDKVNIRIKKLGSRYGFSVDSQARIWQLSMGERQRVEILKILYRNSEVLILDEPTALLAPQEVTELFVALRRMAEEGRSVVLITHKLLEVMQFSDRVTVLRQGRVVGTKSTRQTNEGELASLMVGRPLLFEFARSFGIQGTTVLEVRNLQVYGDKGILAVNGVSFQLSGGEILGIAGVAGNGQRDLAEAITGLRRTKAGQVIIEGIEYTYRSPREVLEAGVAYVPEDRLAVGIVPTLSVAENLVLRTYRYAPYSNGLWLNEEAIRETATRLIEAFGIATPDERNLARALSGGNLQKLILARELSRNPKVLVAEHPTRGLDVGATEYVRARLLEARKNGTGILLISEDLDELLAISDRVAVIFGGRIVGVMPIWNVDVKKIGLMMTGSVGQA